MTPAEIAKSLTKAQRDALEGAAWSIMERTFVLGPHRARNSLMAKDMVSKTPSRTLSGNVSRAHRLTPLGLAVRAAIEEGL